MKIKHKESGKVFELMDGSLYPKNAYDLVDGKASTQESVDKTVIDNTTKKLAAKKSPAKKTAAKKPASKKSTETKTETDGSVTEKTQPSE